MTTTVFLVRHAQTKSNTTGFYTGWSDEDLNDFGYTQARRLSSRLANWPIAAVYTSPLRRTCTTAAILAEPHELDLEVMQDLIEIRLGDFQGLYRDEIRQRWPDLWQQLMTDPSDVTMPNGESFQQVTERAARAFNTVISANQGRQVAVVTHEVVIKVLVTHIALATTNSIYRRFEVNNASLSIMRLDDNKVRLITLNDTSHLEPMLKAKPA
jgi:broad specificity phosphatase PhoE